VKKGESEIEGLTDQTKPRRLGPKRATRIRKLFNLSKEDDVRKYAIRRKIEKDGKKPVSKAPKIQRLVTPRRLQRKRAHVTEIRHRYEKTRKEAETYNALLALRHKEAREARSTKLQKQRSESRKLSEKSETAPKTDAAKTGSAPAAEKVKKPKPAAAATPAAKPEPKSAPAAAAAPAKAKKQEEKKKDAAPKAKAAPKKQ